MKTNSAMHIAELLWDDTVSDGSLFDQLVKMYPMTEKLKAQGRKVEADNNVLEIKMEIVARWANIIMDHEHHVSG